MRETVGLVIFAIFGVLVLLAGLIGIVYIAFELYAYIVKKVSDMRRGGLL